MLSESRRATLPLPSTHLDVLEQLLVGCNHFLMLTKPEQQLDQLLTSLEPATIPCNQYTVMY
jgi:hypothetical protein